MTSILDDRNLLDRLDPQGMMTLVEGFREQCAQAEILAREFALPEIKGIHHAVICGMGGSAIGGDLLRAYAANDARIPIEVLRNYTLPNSVNENTIIIACSNSGNTEETLSAYEEAKRRSARILAITTGGELADRCKRDGNPCLAIPGGISPRAALGYSFLPLLVLFERLGLISSQHDAIQSMYSALTDSVEAHGHAVPEADNPAIQLARTLQGSIPVVYAGIDAFAPVAVRWRCQFNENAKHFAHDSVLPEMNHNEILGWKNPELPLNAFHAIFLFDDGYHPQTKKRFNAMKSIIEPYANGITEVHSKGTGLLARMFYTISFGDFASVYLAYLNQEDPTPIPAIDLLKREMAER